jgi:hypothetical protein
VAGPEIGSVTGTVTMLHSGCYSLSECRQICQKADQAEHWTSEHDISESVRMFQILFFLDARTEHSCRKVEDEPQHQSFACSGSCLSAPPPPPSCSNTTVCISGRCLSHWKKAHSPLPMHAESLSGPLPPTLTVLFLSSNRKADNSRPLGSFHLSPKAAGVLGPSCQPLRRKVPRLRGSS